MRTSRPRSCAEARAVILVMAGLLLSCVQSEAEREQAAMKAAVPERVSAEGSVKLSAEERRAIGLATQNATSAELPKSVLRYGKVVLAAGTEALVAAPSSAQLAREPLVLVGQSVRQGDEILALSPVLAAAEQISLGVQGAQLGADIEAAERQLAKAQADAVRARELAASNIVSAAKLQEVETALASLRARLDGLKRAKAVQAGANGTDARRGVVLRAPIPGMVSFIRTGVGAPVAQGEVLARIIREGPRWIDLTAPFDDRPGLSYEVIVGAGTIPARLLAAGATATAEGVRQDRLEVSTGDANLLLPGATVPVRVAQRLVTGVVVPEAALIEAAGGALVYVEQPANIFSARVVQVRARFASRASVTGVSVGETIVVSGAMALRGETLRAQLQHQE